MLEEFPAGSSYCLTTGAVAPSRRVPSGTVYKRMKVVLERALAATLLFALSPVVLAGAFVVRLTSAGPSFYSQVRLGRRGRRFRIFKLRTMTYECEVKTGAVWAGKNDPRVTRVGRILRRLHLDELPQLWNIACGDMSFIGPRPERPEIVEKLLLDIPNFNDRLLMQPGLTGLAQVLQGADVNVDSARRKLRYDLEYSRREGCWLDIRIIVGTTLIIFGAPRPAVGRLMALDPKPERPSKPVVRTPATLSDCIFDTPREGKKLCDSGVIGAV